MALREFLLPLEAQPNDGAPSFADWVPEWCWHAPMGRVLVPGRATATSTSYSGVQAVTPGGVALSHNGSSQIENWQFTDFATSLPIVIGGVFTVTETSTANQTAVGIGGSVLSSGIYGGIGQGTSAAKVASWLRTTIAGPAAEVVGPTAVVGQTYSVVRISRAVNDHVMYVGGVRYTSTDTAINLEAGLWRNFSIGASQRDTTPLFYGKQSVALGFIARTDPGDEWMRAWSTNPWLLFAPRRIWVPVSAGGGGSHDATGAMSAQSATVSGSAAAVATYTSSGALTAQAATVAGSANHVTTHASSGVLEAQAASVSGAANHVGAHGSTGALEAQAATVAGSADHAAGGAFSATGALTAQAAAVAGSAVHLTLHTATGALASGSATAAGAAVHYTLHTAAGDLVADAASIAGSALHEGDGAEVAKPFTGAGRPRRTRQRVVVEIDGEDFIAASSEEAQAILDQAKEAAEEKAKVAIERATKARNRPTRKVMADARKALELPAISAPDLGGYAEEISRQIEDIYQSAIQTIEVAALLRKRELEEEDDEDILMLL